MTTLNWPGSLVPSAEVWTLVGTSRSGGQSGEGSEQVVRSPTARWKASLTIPCLSSQKVLDMRALILGLDGRTNTVLVGPIETDRAPWVIDPLTGAGISYRRGALNAATDPAYATNTDTNPTLDFRCASPAALNASTLTLQRNRGGLLRPGQYFSFNNWLHMVVALTSTDTGGPGTIGISFRPWLREARGTGDYAEFGQPLSRMRLASDDAGALKLQLSRFGTVTLDLIEAF